jgi:hypothetical protein
MEETTITNLPNAAALTGSERVPMDQGGTTVDATTAAIAATLPDATTTTAGKLSAADKARLDQLGADDSPSFAGLTITGSNAVVIPHIHGDVAGTLYFHVKNVSGGPLTKGTPISVVGAVGNTTTLEVEATNPSVVGVTQAHGLLYADLADNASGHAVLLGELQDVNTALAPGSVLWVGASGGTTGTRPASGAQQVATVGRQHATTGTLLVAIQGVEPTPAQIGADPAGAASAAMTAHLAAADPHAQYLTQTEGDARYPLNTDPSLSNAREWTAATITQADAEAGTSTTRTAWTAQRWRQAAAAWWLTVTSSVGRSLAAAADQAAARTAIGAGTSNLATAGTGTEVQYRNGTALGAIPGSVVDGATGAVQLAGLGAGVSPKPGYSVALGSGVLPRAQVVTAVGSTYTCDIRAANRFMLGAAIAGNTTIAFSGVADLAVAGGFVEYVEVEVDFRYTSGVITISAAGFTTTWDGNTAATPTAGEIETLIVRITPAVTGTPFTTPTVYVAPMRGRT